MKKSIAFVCKTLGFCAVIYALCLVRSPAMRPDLRPTVRAVGAYISGLYPENKVDTVETKENADRIERLVHDLPQTPGN